MQKEIDLGEKLGYAEADLKLIIFKFSIRFLSALLIIFIGLKSNPPSSFNPSTGGLIFLFIIIAGVLIWIISPLFHIKDSITYFEKGIKFSKKAWLQEELGEITFLEYKSGYSIFPKFYMQTDVKNFNITYIKNAKKCFNRAYYDTI